MNAQIKSQARNPFHLDNYQWHYRALLIFSPTYRSPAFQQQVLQFQGQESGLRERDLKLVYLIHNGESYAEQLDDRIPVSEGAAEQIRLQFAVEPDEFAVILVGKDGTQKHRYAEPIQIKELFGAIDSMPMRQYEMQHRKMWK